MFYDLILNNVRSDTNVYGSAIALETDVIDSTGRARFIIYSHRKEDGNLNAFALSFDYMDDEHEWYNGVRTKDFSGVQVANDSINA